MIAGYHFTLNLNKVFNTLLKTIQKLHNNFNSIIISPGLKSRKISLVFAFTMVSGIPFASLVALNGCRCQDDDF